MRVTNAPRTRQAKSLNPRVLVRCWRTLTCVGYRANKTSERVQIIEHQNQEDRGMATFSFDGIICACPRCSGNDFSGDGTASFSAPILCLACDYQTTFAETLRFGGLSQKRPAPLVTPSVTDGA